MEEKNGCNVHTAELGFAEAVSINFVCKNLAQFRSAPKPKSQYLDIPIPKKAIINLEGQNTIIYGKVGIKGVYEPLAKKLSTHLPLDCSTGLVRVELNPRYKRIKNSPHVNVIEQVLKDVPLLGEVGSGAREHVREGIRSLWPSRCHDP